MPLPSYATATMAVLILVGGIQRHQNQRKQREGMQKDQTRRVMSDRAKTQKLVCYYKLEGNYSYRLQPKDIDPCLCTHIIVGFADVRHDLLIPRAVDHLNAYEKVLNLKDTNEDLKVLLSIGAVNGGRFSKMISTQRGRERFIHSVLYFLEKYPFDGLDFDWEFPAWDGGPPMDRINLIYLLKELKLVFKKKSEDFLLTLAVAARAPIILTSYDVPELASLISFVSLLSYDFHYYHPELGYTHHHSALYTRPDNKGQHLTTNVDMAARYWNLLGMPRKKIMIGIATHAQTFKLKTPRLHGVGAPSVGPGLGYGRLPFNKVCYFLWSGAYRIFDVFSRVPYAFKGVHWMSFDDEESVAEKARWVKRNGFGGIMTYNLNNDDWNKSCDNKTTFPIHRTIQGLFGIDANCDE